MNERRAGSQSRMPMTTSNRLDLLRHVMEEAGSYEASMMSFALDLLPEHSNAEDGGGLFGILTDGSSALSDSHRFAAVTAAVLTGLKDAQCYSTLLSIAKVLVPDDPGVVVTNDIPAISLIANYGAWAAEKLSDPELMLRYGEMQLALGRRLSGACLILARGYLWRALGYERFGRLVEAAADYDAGVALVARLRGQPGAAEVEAMLRMNYDDLRHTRGEVAPATLVNHHAEANNSDVSMADRNLYAVRLISSGNLSEGLELLDELQAEALEQGNRRYAGVLASNAGTGLADANNFEAAIERFEDARNFLSAPGCGEHLGVACTALAIAHRVLGRPDVAIGFLQEAWAAFCREAPRSIKALYTLRELGGMRLAEADYRRARSILDRGLQLYESMRIDIGRAEGEHEATMLSYRSILEMHCYLSLVEGWPDEVEGLIERGKARFWAEAIAELDPAQHKRTWPHGQEIRRYRLRDAALNRLVLNYFVGPASTMLVIRNGPNSIVKRIVVREEKLAELVEDVCLSLQATQSRLSEGTVSEAASLLADRLFPDVDFSAVRSVLISPDGPLWALPFDTTIAAARTTGAEQPLPPVSLTPALHVLEAIEARNRAVLPSGEWRVLAVGSPAAGASVQQIPGTRAQVKWVKEVFPTADVLLGEDATPARISRRIDDATHIHIAAHAVADPESEGSYIVLADGKGGPERWYAADIAQLSVKAELVFLSACTTSVGRQSTGEGFMSLGRAFLHAGADCVVSTLWQVSDVWALPLVQHFYGRLASGKSVAVAVRCAQEELRRAGAPPRMCTVLQVVGDGYAAEDDLDTLLEIKGSL